MLAEPKTLRINPKRRSPQPYSKRRWCLPNPTTQRGGVCSVRDEGKGWAFRIIVAEVVVVAVAVVVVIVLVAVAITVVVGVVVVVVVVV